MTDDATLEKAASELYAAVLSDILDELGMYRQVVASSVRPLDDELVLVGRARTGLYRDVYHIPPGHNPYELEIALVDDLAPGEVAVFACGGSGRIAPWGELLTTASLAREARGCVTDGLVRDVRAIRRLGFPVFSAGIAPLDSKGRGEVTAVDVPVECGGVLVHPGDLVFGDADGVVIVPSAAVSQVIEMALTKVEAEGRTRAELGSGAKLGEVFERHGVL